MPQQTDTAPGHYYVTACRNGKYAFLLGPFTNDHATALARVEETRQVANKLDPWTEFDAFGTGWIDPNLIHIPKGRLNDRLGL